MIMSARQVLIALALLPIIAGATGCSRNSRAMRPLTVPQAPPRVVANFPAEPEPTEEHSPTDEPRQPDTDNERFGTPVQARTPRPTPTPQTERPPTASVESSDVARVDDGQLRRQLVTVPDQELSEENVGETLDAAARVLAEVDRTELDSAGRAQYDTARRFLQQARSALAAQNYVFAFFLGEKAQALADAF